MKKKLLISTIVFVFLFGNAVGVLAGSKFKEVKALFYPSIKVELNGQEVNDIKALTYDGSLYVSAKNINEYFGLNSKLIFDSKNNKLTIGGPRYLNLYNKTSQNFYQIIINGNWRSSIQTDERQMYSNYYMGIDFKLVTIESLNLEDYLKQSLKSEYKYLKVLNETSTTISNAEAKVIDYQTNDSVGKLVILHKDSDYVTLMFFVDKTRYKGTDLKEFEKIIQSLNIQ